MAKQFTLKATERLKSRKKINEVFAAGKPVHAGPLRTIYLLQEGLEGPVLQFGCTASSRVFKKAVDRNRIKRLMREAYRLGKKELETVLQKQNKHLFLFVIYTGKEIPTYAGIKNAMDDIIKKLIDVVTTSKQ